VVVVGGGGGEIYHMRETEFHVQNSYDTNAIEGEKI